MRKLTLLLILFTYLVNIQVVDAQVADKIIVKDTRDVSNSPSHYKQIVEFEFKGNKSIEIDSNTEWSGLFSFSPWHDDTGGATHQLAFNTAGIYSRIGYKGSHNVMKNEWESWNQFILGDAYGVIQKRLEVNGTIRAKEIKIESANWADFVFSPNYKLRPLSEVKRHIEEKQHLPDIPSASDVRENGVDVGEMQVKLLQKIEELTLYVIELKHNNDRLEKRIKQLEE